MARILLTLGFLSIVAVAAALGIGLSIGNLYDSPDHLTLRLATVHRLAGTAAALGVVFVESLVVTYFIGTSRWCREVVQTYQLDPQWAAESDRLKRRAFPPAVTGMLAVVAIGALGAASDPATGRPDTGSWVTWHLLAAMAGLAFIGWTYYAAWQNVLANQRIIQAIVERVAAERDRRGLNDRRAPVHTA